MEACRLNMSKLIWAEAKDLRLQMSPMHLQFAPHLWMSSSFLNSSPSLKLWVILLWSSRYLKTNSSTFLASPEKVGSVVEVRHPGCLCHHLLEQLPARRRHLSPPPLQKSSLGSVAAVSCLSILTPLTRSTICMPFLDARYPEFSRQAMHYYDGGWCSESVSSKQCVPSHAIIPSLLSHGGVFYVMSC